MHISCLKFIAENTSYEQVSGKRVIEVGSRDVNGSPRYIFRLLNPSEYVGVDIERGNGVDVVCPSEKLVEMFGENSFDIVVSTEMLEHVLDWKTVVSNLKRALKTNGQLFVTTRSYGFRYHGYPYDFWRYELDDFQKIFADMHTIRLENDPESPGVFLKAIKPENFIEKDLTDKSIYEIVLGCKVQSLDLKNPEFKTKIKRILRQKKQKAKHKLQKAEGKLLKKRICKLFHLFRE